MGEFDIIGIFCDSLNYLQSDEDVVHTFSNAYQHLKEKASSFLMSTPFIKFLDAFIDQTFAARQMIMYPIFGIAFPVSGQIVWNMN